MKVEEFNQQTVFVICTGQKDIYHGEDVIVSQISPVWSNHVCQIYLKGAVLWYRVKELRRAADCSLCQWRLSKLAGHCMGEKYTPIGGYGRNL